MNKILSKELFDIHAKQVLNLLKRVINLIYTFVYA